MNFGHHEEAERCLATLARCFNSVFYLVTGNFIKFALLFAGYDCVIAAFTYDDNHLAIMKGL